MAHVQHGGHGWSQWRFGIAEICGKKLEGGRLHWSVARLRRPGLEYPNWALVLTRHYAPAARRAFCLGISVMPVLFIPSGPPMRECTRSS